jgi:NADPH-dependent 2,4-dienoyl-CoA reductase/sulfur reductase-like enzyme/nitrite reductase/ring-hydroxylating ferredoxin subunit
MGGPTGGPSGSDLAKGIAINDVPDGGTLLGHVGDEAILVARRGSDVFAVGATCTHYGGPLAEGIVVGDTVRCPWHHACFDLRTGEALRAPALVPIACYDVSQSAGMIKIGAKRPERSAAPAAGPSSVVIVGTGAAGLAAAEMLRRRGYAGPITMFGAEPPVDRPNLSKDYLAGNAPEEWIPLKPPEWYDEQKITVRAGVRVTSIDPRAHEVILEDGRKLGYGALLLAPGATPIRLPIPGADLPHVHLLRTLRDSRAIIRAASQAKRAVVIGASFIGLEAAASLRARGLAVDVVAPEARPLERILGPEIGAFIRALHEEKGVTFHLGRKPASIDQSHVALDDGSRLPADLIVMGVGVRPETALAESAGLSIDRGIVVDAELRTSAPDVYAAGDAARCAGVRIEHWVVAERMGQVAARNLLGANERYAFAPYFWSAHYDVVIAYSGHAESWDRIEISGSLEARDAAVTYIKDGQPAALATIFRDVDSLRFEEKLERSE